MVNKANNMEKQAIGKKVRILDNERNRSSPEYSKYIGQIGTIVNPQSDGASCVDIEMPDGEILYPYVPEKYGIGNNKDPLEGEWVADEPIQEEKQSLVGRRVRIINGYDDNEGQEGVVEKLSTDHEENREFLYVKLDNGKRYLPYAPGTEDPQCELIPDTQVQDLSIDAHDEQVYVKCTHKGDKRGITNDKEYPIVGENGIYWKIVNNSGETVSMYKTRFTEPYQKNTHTMTIEQQLVALKQTQKETADRIQALENEIANSYKVGNYYTLTNYDYIYNHTKVKVGDVFKLSKIEGKCSEVQGTVWLIPEGYIAGLCSRDVRPSTADEIRKAQVSVEVKLTIGSKNTDVTIRKDRIETRGANLDISIIRQIVKDADELGSGEIDGWDVRLDKTVRFIRIGCFIENNLFSYNEIQSVITAYEKLQNS